MFQVYNAHNNALHPYPTKLPLSSVSCAPRPRLEREHRFGRKCAHKFVEPALSGEQVPREARVAGDCAEPALRMCVGERASRLREEVHERVVLVLDALAPPQIWRSLGITCASAPSASL
jgi:hypothetical protein